MLVRLVLKQYTRKTNPHSVVVNRFQDVLPKDFVQITR